MAKNGTHALQNSPDTSREALRVAFLNANNWGDAQRTPLAADASTRRYERLSRNLGSEHVMFMDAPILAEGAPCPVDADETIRNQMGWNAQSRLAASRVEAFVAIATHLNAIGLSAPKILAYDLEHGFALLEDFGDAIFARVIEKGENEPRLYAAAAKALAIVHQIPVPPTLPAGDISWPILEFDRLALSVNADLFVDWMPAYDPQTHVTDTDRSNWETAKQNLIDQALSFPRALIMRDYHAENLIWLPERTGAKQVGLLDFQDAVLGWGEWDFAMLLQDARRNVTQTAAEAAILSYLEETGGEREEFDKRLAVLGALNALRVAGIFARLVKRDSKPKYSNFQPRQLKLLAQNLQHPALAEMRDVFKSIAPHILELA
ncbi:aminoglycoside phosphotransferase family protein [Hirschia baltica]|uniref:Aminoglycoside phosphotransferase n=1 Tax=Hirschia baltica (strain ATCC 49814 / DSM 5838 / IFAM 1418) TaxID=582402 RepID=C6XMV3_HIRBI|nr:phosphotransferase [Hirschia baltica]ACT60017.1 aminoglycoside phosphotransferase [Hirschia baltica ATCC 49814]